MNQHRSKAVLRSLIWTSLDGIRTFIRWEASLSYTRAEFLKWSRPCQPPLGRNPPIFMPKP
jgi:hypothetical protein